VELQIPPNPSIIRLTTTRGGLKSIIQEWILFQNRKFRVRVPIGDQMFKWLMLIWVKLQRYMRQKEDLIVAGIRIERLSINVWVFLMKLIK